MSHTVNVCSPMAQLLSPRRRHRCAVGPAASGERRTASSGRLSSSGRPPSRRRCACTCPVVVHDSVRFSDILPLFCRIVPVVLNVVAPVTLSCPSVQAGAAAGSVAVDCHVRRRGVGAGVGDDLEVVRRARREARHGVARDRRARVRDHREVPGREARVGRVLDRVATSPRRRRRAAST